MSSKRRKNNVNQMAFSFPMINVYRSNRVEKLFDAFTQILKKKPLSPFEVEAVSVSGHGMREWLVHRLSETFGVWAGEKFHFHKSLIDLLLSRCVGEAEQYESVFDVGPLSLAILQAYKHHISNSDNSAYAPLKQYLNEDLTGVKGLDIATQIAGVFDEYSLYRPQMVKEWEQGTREDMWQSLLWNSLVEQHGRAHGANVIEQFLKAAGQKKVDGTCLPVRASLFGLSTLSPQLMQVLYGLSTVMEINVFVLSPSKEYWANIRRLGPTRNTMMEDLHVEEGHPLLASLGKQGAHFQHVLESHGNYFEPLSDLYVEPQTAHSIVLHRIQSDMLHLRSIQKIKVGTDFNSDRSVLVHCCHSAQREVEALKDYLLDAFGEKKLSLRPSDIVIMAPSIENYVPFIDAVFGAHVLDDGQNETHLPYRIVGQSARFDGPIVDGFFALLSMVGGRITVNEVFEFLEMTPVRERFGIDETDIMRLRDWVRQTGIRWGIDAQHRVEHGQPNSAQNTWDFGIKRLLLGFGMPTDERFLFEGVLPYDDVEGISDAELLDKFISFLHSLFESLKQFSKKRALAAWKPLLHQFLSDFFSANENGERQLSLLVNCIDKITNDAELAHFDGEVSAAFIHRIFEQRLTSMTGAGRSGDSPGGITFSNLRHMRGIPFKVVCFLGMNGSDFPRMDRYLGFDLMATEKQIGDRSMRDDDRSLFVDAVLSTRYRLLLSYIGADLTGHKEFPASSVVEELLELIDTMYDLGSGKVASDFIKVAHPLQPFSNRYFDGSDSKLFSYHEECCKNAGVKKNKGLSGNLFLGTKLGQLDEQLRQVSLGDLISFFKQPQNAFLERRLGIRPIAVDERLSDREPIELDGLELYQIGNSALNTVLQKADGADLKETFKAKGVLPPGTLGDVTYDVIDSDVQQIGEAITGISKEFSTENLAVDLGFDTADGAFNLSGILSDVCHFNRQVWAYGRRNGKRLLSVWIEHLVLGCLKEIAVNSNNMRPNSPLPIGQTHWIGRGDVGSKADCVVLLDTGSACFEYLSELFCFYHAALNGTFLFLPNTSFAYVYSLENAKGSNKSHREMRISALSKAKKVWEGNIQPGECDSYGAKRVLGDDFKYFFEYQDKPNGFEQTALAVFGPLFAHLEEL